MRQGKWKYRNGELFDLESDIQERTNVAAAHPDVAASLQALRTGFSTSLNASKRSPGSFTSFEVDLEHTRVTVPEGGTAALRARLSHDPGGPVTVTVTPFSGDPDLSVASGGTLAFDSSNWAAWQTVDLAAAQDADTLDRGATFRCATSAMNEIREIFAFEQDDDAVPGADAAIRSPQSAPANLAGPHVRLLAEGGATVNEVPDPAGAEFAWTVAGPGSATVSDPAAQATAVAFPADGEYTVRLAASWPGQAMPGRTDEITVRVGGGTNAVPVSPPLLAYDATADTDGNTAWENTTGVTGRDWALATGAGAVVRDGSDNAPSVAGLEAAYVFSGAAPPSGGRSLHLDAYGTGSASVELWFRPDDPSGGGKQVLWETGGDTGASLTREGATLRFAVDDGGAAPQGALAEASFSARPGWDGFVHVVGVIDLAGDVVRLYADGVEADAETAAVVHDWCGTSYSGLGTIVDASSAETADGGHLGGNDLLGGGTGYGPFDGRIALFRFYDRVLTPDEVATLAWFRRPALDAQAGPPQTVAYTAGAALGGSIGGTAVSSAWSRATGPSPVVFADPDAPATTAAFGLPGDYGLRLTAWGGGVAGFAETLVTVRPLTYTEWAGGEGFPPGEDGGDRDPDGDGLRNDAEFGFGLRGMTADPDGGRIAIAVEPAGGGAARVAVSFEKPRDREPDYVLESTDNLASWDDVPSPAVQDEVLSDTTVRRTMTHELPGGTGRQFNRLRIQP